MYIHIYIFIYIHIYTYRFGFRTWFCSKLGPHFYRLVKHRLLTYIVTFFAQGIFCLGVSKAPKLAMKCAVGICSHLGKNTSDIG